MLASSGWTTESCDAFGRYSTVYSEEFTVMNKAVSILAIASDSLGANLEPPLKMLAGQPFDLGLRMVDLDGFAVATYASNVSCALFDKLGVQQQQFLSGEGRMISNTDASSTSGGSAIFQGKAGARACDAIASGANDTAKYIMIIGIVETVALFVMIFTMTGLPKG